jgi:hypothetical protein
MDDNKKKLLTYLGGGAIAAFAVGTLYYFWKRNSEVKLNEWLEEYIKEVEVMLKNNQGKELTLEIIGHIFQLITEIEDYMYLLKNTDLEEDRLAAIDNEKEYRLIFAETMEVRNEFYEKGAAVVEKRLGISMGAMDEILKKYDPAESKEIIRKARKPYKELPKVSIEKVRDGFIYFVKQKKINEKAAQEQLYMMKMNPDYRTRAMASIYYMKNRLKDEIKAKYGIEDKYLELLIEKYELQKDSEVLYYQQELRSLD